MRKTIATACRRRLAKRRSTVSTSFLQHVSRLLKPSFAPWGRRHALYCGNYPISADSENISGLKPDVIFLVGCQSVHGNVNLPTIVQIGSNTTLMGCHYPLDIAAQCEGRATLHNLCEALMHLHPSETLESWPRQRASARTYASQLIEREETVVREHENDTTIHPSLLESHMVE
jgi:thiamine pyrophosphate-dependent acetolactate synthase large subunit-like protein